MLNFLCLLFCPWILCRLSAFLSGFSNAVRGAILIKIWIIFFNNQREDVQVVLAGQSLTERLQTETLKDWVIKLQYIQLILVLIVIVNWELKIFFFFTCSGYQYTVRSDDTNAALLLQTIWVDFKSKNQDEIKVHTLTHGVLQKYCPNFLGIIYIFIHSTPFAVAQK